MRSGDQYVAYPDCRPAERLYITITRVAKDKTWADIRVQTWAVMWTKRQKLKDGRPPASMPMTWDQHDLDVQEADHMVKLLHQCDPNKCCRECDRHSNPHRGCILR